MTKRLKLGMIGGGQGAFIGAVHRLCARMDDKYEFVAGCLSSTPEKATKSAKEIGLDPSRSYPDFKTCLLYTSPSPRDPKTSRMPSSA